jgi:predicted transcriptional regulator
MTPEVPPRNGSDSAEQHPRIEPNRQLRDDERRELTEYVCAEYADGKSIRTIASTINRSYGQVHRLLADAGVQFRGRGGARKGPRK